MLFVTDLQLTPQVAGSRYAPFLDRGFDSSINQTRESDRLATYNRGPEANGAVAPSLDSLRCQPAEAAPYVFQNLSGVYCNPVLQKINFMAI